MIQVQPRFYPRSDQSAVHRIRVPLHVEQTPRVPPHLPPFGRPHPPCRQLPHHRQLFGQSHPPAGIPLREQILEELRVLRQASKITAPAQQQRLLHPSLKAVVALLHISVLIRTHRIGVPRLHPVIPHHPCIAPVELFLLAHVVHRAR